MVAGLQIHLSSEVRIENLLGATHRTLCQSTVRLCGKLDVHNRLTENQVSLLIAETECFPHDETLQDD